MLFPVIKKATAFFNRHLHNRLRPGFAGNIAFLLVSISMVAYIAHSDYINDFKPSAVFTEDTEPAAMLFSDDDLFFFNDTLTKMLVATGFNGSVLLAREDQVIFSRSFGFADFRNNTPLAPETPFQLASISKTFTAAAVLKLQQEGRICIDDRVAEHIPEFPWPEISIRHLLNHTSGLQNYMWLVERYWRDTIPPDNEDMLELFIRYPRPIDFRPGTRFAYSNTGFAFLGLLIERVSGQRYSEHMEETIFAPLGLENTFVYDPHKPYGIRDDRAYGFRRWGTRHVHIPDVDHDGVMGDKGIYSNILDLYKWDRAIQNGVLLPDSVWHLAFEHTRLHNDRPVNYGMGWRLQSFLDNHVAHHPGRWNGFRTSLKRFLNDDATLIILNNNSRNITRLVEDLQNILFYREITLEQESPEKEDPDDYEVIGGGS